MNTEFLQAREGNFLQYGKQIILRGFSIGSWMDIENFMLRVPGSDKRIRETYAEVYGQANEDKFFDDFLTYFLAEDDFILLKELGVNVLRLPFSYRHFENDQKPGEYKEKGFRHLDRVLELCRKYGIYAILDMHAAPGGQNPDVHGGGESGTSEFWGDATSRQRIINLWGALAKRYKEDTIIAGYDILNEPCYISDIDAFNDFYDKVIDEIRAVDLNHILFLEGDDWAKDFGVFKKLGGYQQAISFHFYPGQHVYLSTEREERKAQLESKISYYTGLRERTGMPLWVGETGGHFSSDRLSEGLILLKDCLDIFEKHGISWTIWSYKDAGAMGMVFPNPNTQWIKMTDKFRQQSQVISRSNPTMAKEILKMLEERFSYQIGDEIKEMLKFRVFALLNELHVRYLLKPELTAIPWAEMEAYPESFLLKNCEGSEELADLIKHYTMSVPLNGTI